ncbi:LacI family DNA-binding transcriptional regulator [Alkaliflexus imshenetskii]|uniref:LacI family DNA-binding transcriptional regulator n=1 Tax=Alkaliflexus imshenetskii TaxID=286730 RepID=UPI0004798332|nr:LacI family DNA-binding transcriptional regulator [Alkaliflexus imshenetskii]
MSKSNISIKELASLLGLSITTVSRVLNNKAKEYRIKEETEKKVRDAAERYHYAPNQFARGLKLDKSETIGVIAPDISNPFFADIIKQIEKVCRNRGYLILIGDSNEDHSVELQMVERFENRKVDGLIVAPVGLEFSHLQKIYKRGIPLVLVDRIAPGIDLPSVSSDNYMGAYNAIELLIKNGHQNIACVQGLTDSQTNNDRVRGYTEAMRKYGLSNEIRVLGSSFTIENGYINSKQLLTQKYNKPTAILAMNNRISFGVLQAASELKVSIPENLSLISFDEQIYSAYLNPPMTTIEQNKTEIAKLAVDSLFEQFDSNGKENMKISKIIPTRINIRDSIKKINY